LHSAECEMTRSKINGCKILKIGTFTVVGGCNGTC